MYRVWFSTESFADFIIDHTDLKKEKNLVKNVMYESDASKPRNFFTVPDHIKKILYLDACDLIVEKDNEPIFSIEITTEAGTGHNAFQRFARIAASAESGVPSLYIYPDGAIISRQNAGAKWDEINPLVFKALESVMCIYQIPALLFYFPTDMKKYLAVPEKSPNFGKKGLRFDANVIKYSGCPDSKSSNMKRLFTIINEILKLAQKYGVVPSREKLLQNLEIRKHQGLMQSEYISKAGDRKPEHMSPLSAVVEIPTSYLINYLKKYESNDYTIGDLLKSRPKTKIYQVNAKFRGDPYPGALSAIDYLMCREGKSFEERKFNLVLAFGKIVVDKQQKIINLIDEKNSTIKDFFKDVKNSARHNLLIKDYEQLHNFEIPRYLMQVRYGSTFSKVKHIRVYSYFSDAILFPDGSLWRDA